MNYKDMVLQLMEDELEATETHWLRSGETVFERCWWIIEQMEGRDELERRFPEYK